MLSTTDNRCAVEPRSPDDGVELTGRAAFAVRRHSPARVVVTVDGEIDATNGRALGRFVERHTGISTQLVLDLSDVEFFGCQGFRALYYIGVHCARSDVDWALVGSPAVRRLLQILDPNNELPLVEDLAAAESRLDCLARCHRLAMGRG
ncbi:STAS domain-containing protein [Mycobacterium sp. NPDC050041]|uniref:STAS domain-containing protein n=1 Tax=Mycobacterium sp. NPDC050041 TaxID=3364293 RepID=UPI003C2B0AEE